MKIAHTVSSLNLKSAIAILLLILPSHALSFSRDISPPVFVILGSDTNAPPPATEDQRQDMRTYLQTLKQLTTIYANKTSDKSSLSKQLDSVVTTLRSLNQIPEAQLHGDFIAINMAQELLKGSPLAAIPVNSIDGFSGLANACQLGLKYALMLRGYLRYSAFLSQTTDDAVMESAIRDFRHGFENLLIIESLAQVHDNYNDDQLATMQVYDLIKGRPYQRALYTNNLTSNPELISLTKNWAQTLKQKSTQTPSAFLKTPTIDDPLHSECEKISISPQQQNQWLFISIFLDLLHRKAIKDTHSSLTLYDLHLATALVAKMQLEITNEVDSVTSFLPDNLNNCKSFQASILPFHTQLQVLRRLALAVDSNAVSDSAQSATARKTLLAPYLKEDPFVLSIISALQEATEIETPYEATRKINETLSANASLSVDTQPVDKRLLLPTNYKLNKHFSEEGDEPLGHLGWHAYSSGQENLSSKEQAATSLIEEIEKSFILPSAVQEKTTSLVQHDATFENKASDTSSLENSLQSKKASLLTPKPYDNRSFLKLNPFSSITAKFNEKRNNRKNNR